MFFKKREKQIFKSDDFPSLNQMHNAKALIYFDNACVSLRPKSVIEKMTSYYEFHPSCARRSAHSFGIKTTQEVETSRNKICSFLNCDFQEFIFTQNATASLNLIANGLNWENGDVVVTTNLEHNSNTLPWMRLQQTQGIKHLKWEILPDGTFDLDNLNEILSTTNVKLISIFSHSHVLGTRLPIEKIIDVAKKNNVMTMIDASQSLLHEKINLKELGCDFLALSFHKALGPSGLGGLYINKDSIEKVFPTILGGETVDDVNDDSYSLSGSPYCYEAGLQNYSAIMGAASACMYLDEYGYEKIVEKENLLGQKLLSILESHEKISILGPKTPRNLFNFYIEGLDMGEVSILLDKYANIMTRSGVHCAHSWFRHNKLNPSLRVSLAFYNELNELDIFEKVLDDIIRHHT